MKLLSRDYLLRHGCEHVSVWAVEQALQMLIVSSPPASADGDMAKGLPVKRKEGFTLVELLVVVGIIALLVTILMPSLGRAMALARRAVCGGNLKNIGLAVHLYANDYDGKCGGIGNGYNSGWQCIGKRRWLDMPGDEPNPDIAYKNNYSNSRSLWLYVLHADAAPEQFLCPAVKNTVASEYQDDHRRRCYDFRDHNALSYSYQVQQKGGSGWNTYTTSMNDNGDLALLADRNANVRDRWYALPSNQGGEYCVIDDTFAHLTGNSANHKREGQNVLFLRGNMQWTVTPRVGIDGDNIWTNNNGDPASDGFIDPGYRSFPFDPNDSELAP